MIEQMKLVDKLESTHTLSREEWIRLLEGQSPELSAYVFQKARTVREPYYGHRVFIRGLIEFTNICRNDCYYCGIRCSNRQVNRYRLTQEEILECCRQGYALGFRTFVLQGGEDPWFTDERIVELVHCIKQQHPDCAVTLSIGEKSAESYRKFYEAGADRYLLRHETANETHYRQLHPASLSAQNRKRCLWDLKQIGYQVGAGFMVGSPGQTAEHIAEDLLFLQKLQPHMVGIGPFIPQKDTPFGEEKAGTVEQTIFLLGLIRLMLPDVLLPATTALGTIHPRGRELGMEAGANVVMPNLTPETNRKEYRLYDNKLSAGAESAEGLAELSAAMAAIGYEVVSDRGDHAGRNRQEGKSSCAEGAQTGKEE